MRSKLFRIRMVVLRSMTNVIMQRLLSIRNTRSGSAAESPNPNDGTRPQAATKMMISMIAL